MAPRTVGRAGRAAKATAGTDASEAKVTVTERRETQRDFLAARCPMRIEFPKLVPLRS